MLSDGNRTLTRSERFQQSEESHLSPYLFLPSLHLHTIPKSRFSSYTHFIFDMGTPQDYLPQAFAEADLFDFLQTISSPRPKAIRQLKSNAAFHIIYILSYSADELNLWLLSLGIEILHNSSNQLILRISGNHIAKTKTENEVAVLSWIRKNTSIPVPSTVSYDATSNNTLKREYILMTREPGECLADVYQSLSTDQMDSIIDQLIGIQAQLHEKAWSHVGGLRIDGTNIVPGPVLEETFWFEPDIQSLWPSSETSKSLNISGPFDSYVHYIIAHMRKYMHAIEIHPSLEFIRDTLPQVTHFMNMLEKKADKLNQVTLRLAHKDLHYGNILVSKETGLITSILDWEFAGVVPFTRWNPSRAFLWNTQGNTKEALAERDAMYRRYTQRAIDLGFECLVEDAEFSSPEQENMQQAANFLRAIVEVSPRGQRKTAVMGWKKSFLKAMAALDN